MRFEDTNRTLDVRQSHSHVLGEFRTLRTMDTAEIVSRLKARRVPHQDIAQAIGKERTAATKLLGGQRRVQANEVGPLLKLLEQFERGAGHSSDTPEHPTADQTQSYVEVEVLPTFAGMGGGGTGDGDVATALLPRRLVEDELHAKPTDLLVIDLRGDSMEPIFYHGDQVVIDRRDVNPVQPGPFALWDGDGYVVKNVERQRGRYRIFSANPIYSEFMVDPEEVRIMGRPVWYARRL